MGSKIFATMEQSEVQEASKIAKQWMDELTGRGINMIAAVNIISLEHLTKHTHVTMEEITKSVEFLSDFKDKRKSNGSISTAKKPSGIN